MTIQLALFQEIATNGIKTVATAGLSKGAAPGAERLLRELVKRGLPEDSLLEAAALALALDDGIDGPL